MKLRRLGFKAYFSEVWNITEVVILATSYATLFLFRFRHDATEEVMDRFRRFQHSQFISFTELVFRDGELQIALAILAALATYKFMKILTFNPFARIITLTYKRAASDGFGFFVMTFLFITVFAIAGCLSFGRHYFGYVSFYRSLLRVVFFVLGEPYWDDIKDANWFMAHVFFLLAMFFTQYIIINFFIAILGESFNMIQCTILKEKNVALEYLIKELKRWIGIKK